MLTPEPRGKQERILRGIGVTSGVAIAPLYAPPLDLPEMRQRGTCAEEVQALRGALAAACAALEQLIAKVDDESAAILEFQVALAEDEDLLAPVFAAIERGSGADQAWRGVMDTEIAAYRDGDDPVFASRAGDLADLRDRVLGKLADSGEDTRGPTEPSILVGRDLAPSRLLELDPALVAGIALGEGSRTSHVALLARARGIPMLAGLGDLQGSEHGAPAVLDVAAGNLLVHPGEPALTAARQSLARLAAAREQDRALIGRRVRTADGEPVRIRVNIDHESLLDAVDPRHCDGIGLARTEFLFEDGPPDEERQLAVYTRLLEWARGRPVTVRTLDAGGDKPLPGITQAGESNPFLGVRGIRLSLSRTGIFKTQLRALLRAAARGELKIMVPMVTEPAEMDAVRRLLSEANRELAAEGVEHGSPALGMMVEVPAAALCADAFTADFYSIGTNDLIQYATASARDNAAVAHLARADHAGVTALISAVIDSGRRRAREVSVCGDMASDPAGAQRLVALGIRVLSVAPATLASVKAALSSAPREAE